MCSGFIANANGPRRATLRDEPQGCHRWRHRSDGRLCVRCGSAIGTHALCGRKRCVTARDFSCGTWFGTRSEEHTSELQSLMRISYAVFCLKQKNKSNNHSTELTLQSKKLYP